MFKTGLLEVSGYKGYCWTGLLLCQCFAIGAVEGFGRYRFTMGDPAGICKTYWIPPAYAILRPFAHFLLGGRPRDLPPFIYGSFLRFP